MRLAETVLEMLRAYLPGFELDENEAPPPPRDSWRESRREPRPRRALADEPARRAPEQETDPVLARCYAELGVPYEADFRLVRRAWRRLVRQHHPDVQGEDPERQRIGTELVQRVNDAFGEIRRRRLSRGDS